MRDIYDVLNEKVDSEKNLIVKQVIKILFGIELTEDIESRLQFHNGNVIRIHGETKDGEQLTIRVPIEIDVKMRIAQEPTEISRLVVQKQMLKIPNDLTAATLEKTDKGEDLEPNDLATLATDTIDNFFNNLDIIDEANDE